MPWKNPEAQRAYIKQWQKDNPEKVKANVKRWQVLRRAQALEKYGGKCTCCGEDREPFLVLDHIDDDGAEHRKETGNGSRFYVWLFNNNYPEGIVQVLCANCNMAKMRGVCPHKELVIHHPPHERDP